MREGTFIFLNMQQRDNQGSRDFITIGVFDLTSKYRESNKRADDPMLSNGSRGTFKVERASYRDVKEPLNRFFHWFTESKDRFAEINQTIILVFCFRSR